VPAEGDIMSRTKKIIAIAVLAIAPAGGILAVTPAASAHVVATSSATHYWG
jgi:hypothetical protein